ncbi:O-antigen ligase family protein [Autumnicola musiva]|uniref:O-antigen ligase family protein n=1 Tax=Autumnicola musiva TaxID=3075589 RepID=A0ABU3D820_9FLAO|nr:O-antigen ligase family protein [Zunongwangia sp. F117]MDT0677677.1 O-antigen ligase family protein [Zunongwangia sp. F117]
MKYSDLNLKTNILFFSIIFFFTYIGFYAIVLWILNIGMSGETRLITIPLRGLIGVSLIFLVIINIRKIYPLWQTKIFFIFSAIYFIRIGTDYILNKPYYLTSMEVFFYFLSFAFLPFTVISSVRLRKEYFKPIINSIYGSGIIFVFLATITYREYIGKVERLSPVSMGEEVVSPLILSYCSSLLIGTVITYHLYNHTSKFRKIIGLILVLFSLIPFFLGASRGSLVGLLAPFVLITLMQKRFSRILYNVLILLVLLIGLIYFDNLLGSGLLNRFTDTAQNIKNEDSSAGLRILSWNNSFKQFLNNPFIGDKLAVNNWVNYAHNIFLEILQTTGILGFLPFILLLLNGLKISFKIIKAYKEYSWIVVIFLQSFIQHLFSGAIYTGAWLWTSLALIYSLDFFLKRLNNSTRNLRESSHSLNPNRIL